MISALFSISLGFVASAFGGQAQPLRLYPGFITKVRCEGRLLVSAIGDEERVRLEALPKDLGCGVLLKPLKPQTKTNLILETSTGSIKRIVEVAAKGAQPGERELEYAVKGDAK